MADRKGNDTPEPGSYPDVSYAVERIGGQYWNIINDPRLIFHREFAENLGARYDKSRRVLAFTKEQTSEFEEVRDRVKETPYFEIDRGLTPYAGKQLLDAKFPYVKRPVFANNPDGPQITMWMAPTRADWLEGQTIAYKASRAPADKIEQIKEFAATGKLKDADFEQAVGMNAEDFFNAADAEMVAIPQANKLLAKCELANEKSLERVAELVKTGQLNDQNAGVSLDPNKLAKLSQEQVYDLINRGRKYATQAQRDQVLALKDAGYVKLKDDVNELTGQDARAMVSRAVTYMSSEERGYFETLGTKEGTHGHQNRDGSYTRPQTPEERHQNSLAAMKQVVSELHKSNPDLQIVDVPTKKPFAVMVVDATPQHILGYLNDSKSEGVLLERSDIWLKADTSEMLTAEHGEKAPIVGNVVAFTNNKEKPFGEVSDQKTIGAAICELEAKITLRGMGKEYGTAATPSQPTKGAVIAKRDNYASILLESNKVLTVDTNALDTKTPKFLQEVTFTPATAPAAPAAAGQSQGNGRKQRQTAGAAR